MSYDLSEQGWEKSLGSVLKRTANAAREAKALLGRCQDKVDWRPNTRWPFIQRLGRDVLASQLAGRVVEQTSSKEGKEDTVVDTGSKLLQAHEIVQMILNEVISVDDLDIEWGTSNWKKGEIEDIAMALFEEALSCDELARRNALTEMVCCMGFRHDCVLEFLQSRLEGMVERALRSPSREQDPNIENICYMLSRVAILVHEPLTKLNATGRAVACMIQAKDLAVRYVQNRYRLFRARKAPKTLVTSTQQKTLTWMKSQGIRLQFLSVRRGLATLKVSNPHLLTVSYLSLMEVLCSGEDSALGRANRVKLVSAGGLCELWRLLIHPNALIRRAACSLTIVLAQDSTVRMALVERDMLTPLSMLLLDEAFEEDWLAGLTALNRIAYLSRQFSIEEKLDSEAIVRLVKCETHLTAYAERGEMLNRILDLCTHADPKFRMLSLETLFLLLNSPISVHHAVSAAFLAKDSLHEQLIQCIARGRDRKLEAIATVNCFLQLWCVPLSCYNSLETKLVGLLCSLKDQDCDISEFGRVSGVLLLVVFAQLTTEEALQEAGLKIEEAVEEDDEPTQEELDELLQSIQAIQNGGKRVETVDVEGGVEEEESLVTDVREVASKESLEEGVALARELNREEELRLPDWARTPALLPMHADAEHVQVVVDKMLVAASRNEIGFRSVVDRLLRMSALSAVLQYCTADAGEERMTADELNAHRHAAALVFYRLSSFEPDALLEDSILQRICTVLRGTLDDVYGARSPQQVEIWMEIAVWGACALVLLNRQGGSKGQIASVLQTTSTLDAVLAGLRCLVFDTGSALLPGADARMRSLVLVSLVSLLEGVAPAGLVGVEYELDVLNDIRDGPTASIAAFSGMVGRAKAHPKPPPLLTRLAHLAAEPLVKLLRSKRIDRELLDAVAKCLATLGGSFSTAEYLVTGHDVFEVVKGLFPVPPALGRRERFLGRMESEFEEELLDLPASVFTLAGAVLRHWPSCVEWCRQGYLGVCVRRTMLGGAEREAPGAAANAAVCGEIGTVLARLVSTYVEGWGPVNDVLLRSEQGRSDVGAISRMVWMLEPQWSLGARRNAALALANMCTDPMDTVPCMVSANVFSPAIALLTEFRLNDFSIRYHSLARHVLRILLAIAVMPCGRYHGLLKKNGAVGPLKGIGYNYTLEQTSMRVNSQTLGDLARETLLQLGALAEEKEGEENAAPVVLQDRDCRIPGTGPQVPRSAPAVLGRPEERPVSPPLSRRIPVGGGGDSVLLVNPDAVATPAVVQHQPMLLDPTFSTAARSPLAGARGRREKAAFCLSPGQLPAVVRGASKDLMLREGFMHSVETMGHSVQVAGRRSEFVREDCFDDRGSRIRRKVTDFVAPVRRPRRMKKKR